MKYYWTKFLFKYPKTIVYMLQSSEYNILNYLKWVDRTKDYRKVMHRRELDRTKKAKLLLIICWLIEIYVIAISLGLIYCSFKYGPAYLFVLAILILFNMPYFVAYGVTIPLWFGQVYIQKPQEQIMIRQAKGIVAKHSAFKIAIAGSFGKTTAKEILNTILSEGKKVACTPGNMNTPIGISRFVKKLDGLEDVLIFELGEERVGDVRELCNIVKPDQGIITGINEAHLSTFGTLELTTATIFELGNYLGKKPLYKNIESELVRKKITKNDKLAYSRSGVNGWVVDNIKVDITGTSFSAKKDKISFAAHTGLIGEHNVGVIMAAVDIADSLGLSIDQIKSGIEKTVPFEHRMQPRKLNGAWIIDDTYNGNSQGVAAGLALLKNLDAKRRIYVSPGLVGQGSKTKEVHEKMGKQIAEVADFVVLMKNSVTDHILAGLESAKYKGNLMVIDDPLDFYKNLDQFVAVGDVVLMQNDWTDNYE